MMIKTVFFDIDNTLYSYDQANEKAMKKIYGYCFREFGWSLEECEERLGASQREIGGLNHKKTAVIHNRLIRFQNMLEMAKKPVFPHSRSLYQLYWKELLTCMDPEPGAKEFLCFLKKSGIRIGIATDMTAYMQFRKLEILGMAPYIDFMVTSEEAGAEKPERAFYERCLDKTPDQPNQCLMIGDNLKKDVQGALNMGMEALWYHKEETKDWEERRFSSFGDTKKLASVLK
ncbi:MAG: HAD family hydrolase [Lachnospiraceae bacterium]|nr:HAD family hydrolase [Lachnospiraceae bacterium]